MIPCLSYFLCNMMQIKILFQVSVHRVQATEAICVPFITRDLLRYGRRKPTQPRPIRFRPESESPHRQVRFVDLDKPRFARPRARPDRGTGEDD